LVSDGKVKASLFDLSGREVYTLFDDYQPVGLHSVGAVISPDIPSGIYMVRLTLNGAPYARNLLVRN
ncbi:MAG: T9SS type A sorting domain-containing protein, partial [Bacteroidia bacterium]